MPPSFVDETIRFISSAIPLITVGVKSAHSARQSSIMPKANLEAGQQAGNMIQARRVLELEDVLRLLRSEIKRAGSQRRFAREANVNSSVVSRTMSGQVGPSEKILCALKLRKVYLPK